MLRWAEIDLDAVRHNVRTLAELASPAKICAVVKADAYGHGAVPVGKAAIEGGAAALAVESVDDAIELRCNGVDAQILALSEPPDDDSVDEVVKFSITPVVSTFDAIETIARRTRALGNTRRQQVHLRIDTGIGVGCATADAVELSSAIARRSELVLDGVCTHLALAEEPEHPFTRRQLEQFNDIRRRIAERGVLVRVSHAANTAATLTLRAGHFDMVRCGSGIYGIEPARLPTGNPKLHPVLSVKARIAHVRCFPRGTNLSYGLHEILARASRIATLPIGYASGIPRALVGRGEVLIHGTRCRIVGNIMMDQVFVDVGDLDVAVGDVAVIIGEQCGDAITAIDVAQRCNTIADEIVCALGARLPRRYVSRHPNAPPESRFAEPPCCDVRKGTQLT